MRCLTYSEGFDTKFHDSYPYFYNFFLLHLYLYFAYDVPYFVSISLLFYLPFPLLSVAMEIILFFIDLDLAPADLLLYLFQNWNLFTTMHHILKWFIIFCHAVFRHCKRCSIEKLALVAQSILIHEKEEREPSSLN